MTSSFGQLKQAQNRFADCIESCKAVDASNKDKTILVPLTSSLYVPGKLANVEKVIVDIGTGYYVEKVRKGLQRVAFSVAKEDTGTAVPCLVERLLCFLRTS